MDMSQMRQDFTATLMESRRGEMMAPRVNQARFFVRSAPGKRARRIEAQGAVLTLGRAPGNHIVVEDSQVSAVHAEFRLAAEGAWFRDLGSTNGIWHGDVQVSEGFLPEGAEVRIGATAVGLEQVRETPEPQSSRRSFGAFLGKGTEMARMFAQLRRAAETHYPVLIQGETGVGKELLASAVHEASRRADASYQTISCGALPDSLIESELFGYEEGAFTGAKGAKRGVFERADGGTVFFDEIGELPLLQQAKLLRVLDPGVVRRLGEDGPERQVDVRIVAATNRDLRQMVNRGEFREDLFFRLAVVPISVPPLRERSKGNLELLVKTFAAQVGEELALNVSFSREAKKALERHAWPGNARELLSVVRACAVGAWGEGDEKLVVSGEAVGRVLAQLERGGVRFVERAVDTSVSYDDFVAECRRSYVRAVVDECQGNKVAAAQRLGMSRTTLYRILG
jgi:transcriptional regulator with GAF, ATPase, and Fis domain